MNCRMVMFRGNRIDNKPLFFYGRNQEPGSNADLELEISFVESESMSSFALEGRSSRIKRHEVEVEKNTYLCACSRISEI